MLDNNISRGTGGGRYYSWASIELWTKGIWEKKHNAGKPRVHILTSLWSLTLGSSFSPRFPKRRTESENTSLKWIFADIFCSVIRARCTQHLVRPIPADRRTESTRTVATASRDDLGNRHVSATWVDELVWQNNTCMVSTCGSANIGLACLGCVANNLQNGAMLLSLHALEVLHTGCPCQGLVPWFFATGQAHHKAVIQQASTCPESAGKKSSF